MGLILDARGSHLFKGLQIADIRLSGLLGLGQTGQTQHKRVHMMIPTIESSTDALPQTLRGDGLRLMRTL